MSTAPQSVDVNLAEGPLSILGKVPVGSQIYVWFMPSGNLSWGPREQAGTPLPTGSRSWGSDASWKISATVIGPLTCGWLEGESYPSNMAKASDNKPYVKQIQITSGEVIVQILSKTKGNTLMNTTALVTTAATTLTKEGIDAAWRTAASSSLKVVRAPLLKAMKTHGLSENTCEAAMSFMETNVGEALFAIVLGSLLSGAPINNPKLTRLASELRILGLSNFTDQFAEIFAQVLSGLVGQLPDT